MNKGSHAIPGPQGRDLVRWLRALSADPCRTLLRAQREYGDVVEFRLPPPGRHRRFIVVAQPDDIQHVLQANHANYQKTTHYDPMRPFLGNGLLLSEGDFWHRQRRLAQPMFHKARLEGFAGIMVDESNRLLERWHGRNEDNAGFDVGSDMHAMTLGIVGRTLFSVQLDEFADTIAQNLKVALDWADDQIGSAIPLPLGLPTPENRRVRKTINQLTGLVDTLIANRRGDEGEFEDLLSMLLEVKDEETGESMSDKQIRDEVLTFVAAGHETTANALTWTWYLLNQNIGARERLEDELAAVLGGRAPTFADFERLPYTRQVIDESMRLYPPAWIVERAARGPDVVGGHAIEADTAIAMSQFLTHRHPDLWDEPSEFRPERFEPEAQKARHRFAYFPFGGGPRLCIGNMFAIVEATLLLANLAQHFRLNVLPGPPPDLDASITLRPRGGIRVTLEPAPARATA